MNSPPNWEELLDIDDSDLRLSANTQNANTQNKVSYENPNVDGSDLRLSAITQNMVTYENPQVEICAETPVIITRGPAGIVQTTNIRKITDVRKCVSDGVMATQEYVRKVFHDVGEDSDFNSWPWIRAVEYMKPNGGILIGRFADIEKFLKKGKLDEVVAIIKSCTPNVLGDLTVTLKDVSGFMSGTIHHKVVNDERFEKRLVVGAVLILHNVSVFSPKRSGNHYLNITIKNVVEVFSEEPVPNNRSDVGSSGSLI